MTECTSAKLFSYTQPAIGTPVSGPEEIIAHCARVSSPREYSDRGKDSSGLLNYCIKNKHWSVFTMCDATVELELPRDIGRQSIRHWTFDFQEFSQRYSDEFEFTVREIRRQDSKNRQNSVDDFTPEEKLEFEIDCQTVIEVCNAYYKKWQDKGGAKECCRVFLPEGLTMSSMYMKGNLRSWLTYLEVREDVSTQKEHRVLANQIRKAIEPVFPTILGLTNE